MSLFGTRLKINYFQTWCHHYSSFQVLHPILIFYYVNFLVLILYVYNTSIIFSICFHRWFSQARFYSAFLYHFHLTFSGYLNFHAFTTSRSGEIMCRVRKGKDKETLFHFAYYFVWLRSHEKCWPPVLYTVGTRYRDFSDER